MDQQYDNVRKIIFEIGNILKDQIDSIKEDKPYWLHEEYSFLIDSKFWPTSCVQKTIEYIILFFNQKYSSELSIFISYQINFVNNEDFTDCNCIFFFNSNGSESW